MYFVLLHPYCVLTFCSCASVIAYAQQCHSDMCKILTKNIDCIIDLDQTIIVKRCSIVISSARWKLFGYYSPRRYLYLAKKASVMPSVMLLLSPQQ